MFYTVEFKMYFGLLCFAVSSSYNRGPTGGLPEVDVCSSFLGRIG
jgi:hypothetical protein